MHTHFRDPGLTYKEDIFTGSSAAVRGGYTGVNLMANTKPICSDMETFNYVVNKAKEYGLVDAHQIVSITRNLEGKDTSHLEDIDWEKVKFVSDDGKGVSDSKVMIQAMLQAKKYGATIICHAETAELSSLDMRLAENTMTWRDISLAKFTGCKLHMAHVSTKEAMAYVVEAKESGASVTCEVAPHHIALTEDISTYRVNPPIRAKEDVEALIKAIKDGYVDAIATDHAPHTAEDKKNGAPGISGIETSFSVCYSSLVKAGHISLNKLSEIMSKRPAELMAFNKGKISIGYEGDLVLVDLDKKYVVKGEEFASKGKNTCFEGHEVYGQVLKTIKAGKVVYSL
jgi:dihydroorotase